MTHAITRARHFFVLKLFSSGSSIVLFEVSVTLFRVGTPDLLNLKHLRFRLGLFTESLESTIACFEILLLYASCRHCEEYQNTCRQVGINLLYVIVLDVVSCKTIFNTKHRCCVLKTTHWLCFK